ncbi:MAG: DUF3461 family protein [Thiolinea sp.]
MSENYPTLTAMGIKNPNQIVGYNVYPVKEDMDVLRIRYARPKGSFLPVTRSYRLGRAGKSQTVDSGTRQTVMIYEVSAMLTKAREELDQIVSGNLSKQELKQQILQEMERMENNFLGEMAALRQMLSKFDDI